MILNLAVSAPPLPVVKFTVNGTEYRATAEEVNVPDVWKIQKQGNDWIMFLYASGTLNFNYVNPSCGVFLVGGGQAGGRGAGYGGRGGNGGYRKTVTDSAIPLGTDIPVVIGLGGETNSEDGTASTFSSLTSDGGERAAGNNDYTSTPGEDGAYIFGDSTIDGILYAPAGGKGSYLNDYFQDQSRKGAPGQTNSGESATGGSATSTSTRHGHDAETLGGGGGGGGRFVNASAVEYNGNGGAGNKGFIVLRNSRG